MLRQTPRRAASAMTSGAPSNSGAMVIMRMRPRAACQKRSNVVRVGANRFSGGCTPRRAGLMNGPSRWIPSGRARRLPSSLLLLLLFSHSRFSIASASRSRARKVASIGAVNVVGK